MLVKEWMSKTVVTVEVNDGMQEAMNRLQENNISMLPVMKKGNISAWWTIGKTGEGFFS